MRIQDDAHVIAIRPYADDPEYLDWLCSCGIESDSAFAEGEFGEAAADAVEHVPADQQLIITRPNVIEGGVDRG